MSIVVYTPALALSQSKSLKSELGLLLQRVLAVTGFPLDAACAVIFAVCIVYTTIGGIKAVMWTDTFQGLVMFGSFIAVIAKGNADAGGSSVIFDRNYQSGRIELFE